MERETDLPQRSGRNFVSATTVSGLVVSSSLALLADVISSEPRLVPCAGCESIFTSL